MKSETTYKLFNIFGCVSHLTAYCH